MQTHGRTAKATAGIFHEEDMQRGRERSWTLVTQLCTSIINEGISMRDNKYRDTQADTINIRRQTKKKT